MAQDLGLAPKDRLIRVEGLDVKTLPFDRIGMICYSSISRGYNDQLENWRILNPSVVW